MEEVEEKTLVVKCYVSMLGNVLMLDRYDAVEEDEADAEREAEREASGRGGETDGFEARDGVEARPTRGKRSGRSRRRRRSGEPMGGDRQTGTRIPTGERKIGSGRRTEADEKHLAQDCSTMAETASLVPLNVSQFFLAAPGSLITPGDWRSHASIMKLQSRESWISLRFDAGGGRPRRNRRALTVVSHPRF